MYVGLTHNCVIIDTADGVRARALERKTRRDKVICMQILAHKYAWQKKQRSHLIFAYACVCSRAFAHKPIMMLLLLLLLLLCNYKRAHIRFMQMSVGCVASRLDELKCARARLERYLLSPISLVSRRNNHKSANNNNNNHLIESEACTLTLLAEGVSQHALHFRSHSMHTHLSLDAIQRRRNWYAYKYDARILYAQYIQSSAEHIMSDKYRRAHHRASRWQIENKNKPLNNVACCIVFRSI